MEIARICQKFATSLGEALTPMNSDPNRRANAVSRAGEAIGNDLSRYLQILEAEVKALRTEVDSLKSRVPPAPPIR